MGYLSQQGCVTSQTPLREEQLIFWCEHATCVNLVPHSRHSGSFADLSSSLLLTSVVQERSCFQKHTVDGISCKQNGTSAQLWAIILRTVWYGISDGSWNFILRSGKAAKNIRAGVVLEQDKAKGVGTLGSRPHSPLWHCLLYSSSARGEISWPWISIFSTITDSVTMQICIINVGIFLKKYCLILKLVPCSIVKVVPSTDII